MDFEISQRDMASLQSAVRRNPALVLKKTKQFFSSGITVYNRLIIRNPWRMGQSGGGSPVDTGNLRDRHRKEIKTWEARIYPTVPYAPYVHGLGGQRVNSRGVQLRPWLDYAMKEGDARIRQLEIKMLQDIVTDLAK